MRLRYLAGVLFVVTSTPIAVLPPILGSVPVWVAVPFGLVAGGVTSVMLYVAWRVDRARLTDAGVRW
jgi:uncharacterized membrane protein